MIYFDTETFLIAPGLGAPPIVCVQWCKGEDRPLLGHVRDVYETVRSWFVRKEPICGHNVAFDMAVICAQWPDLTPLVFSAYAENRVTCTQIRERLIAIATGRG